MFQKKICVICPRMGMGDLVSFLAHFKTIYKQKKQKLIIITKESTSAKQILAKEYFFERIIYLPKRKRGLINFFSHIVDFFKLCFLIKKTCCDEVFILHASKRYAIASKIAGIKKIYAPGFRLQKFFINSKNRIYNNFFDQSMHPRDESENLIKKIYSIKNLEENYFNKDESNLPKDTILIGIACSGDEKQWGVNNYIKIIEYLVELKYENFCILAGHRQADLEKKIIETFNKNLSLNFISTSNLDIERILSLFKKAKLYLGNDTGFSHITVSLKIPSFIIHGDFPPHNYTPFFFPILPENNILTRTSIKEIDFKNTKKLFDQFLTKYNLL